MAAGRHGPFVEDDLGGADPGTAPRRVMAEKALHRPHVVVEHVPVGGHGVPDAHHELDIGPRQDLPVVPHRARPEDVREVEGFDLGLDRVADHLGSEPVDEIGRVLVDPRREVVRAHRQARHVRLQRQHAAAFVPAAGAAPRRELEDHAGAMRLEALLEARETLGIAARPAFVVPDVAMGDRGARLEGRLGRLDLLGHRDGHRRVVGLGRQRSGDRDADDAGRRHDGPLLESAGQWQA
jgi:hypothetical protein